MGGGLKEQRLHVLLYSKDKIDLFVRMAQRAGSLFDQDEVRSINHRVVDEILQSECTAYPSAKLTTVANSNPLAIWINFLLYHLSLTNPGREQAQKIEPDPFALSMLALERLAEDMAVGKIDRVIQSLAEINFKIAMLFPGEKRAYVSKVVDALRKVIGPDAIFMTMTIVLNWHAPIWIPCSKTFIAIEAS